MKNRRAIIICNTLDEYFDFKKKYSFKNLYIITDNIKFHLYKNLKLDFKNVNFISASLSFEFIQSEEIKLINRLNILLTQKIKKSKRFMVEIDKHVEDNESTGAKIREILLNEKWIKYLLQKYNIKYFFDLRHDKSSQILSSDLAKICYSKNIFFEEIFKKENINFVDKTKVFFTYTFLFFSKYFVYLIKVFFNYKKKISGKKIIVLPVFANTKYHIKTRIDIGRYIDKNKLLKSVILNTNIRSEDNINNKKNIFYMDKFLNIRDLLDILLLFLNFRSILKKNIFKINEHYPLLSSSIVNLCIKHCSSNLLKRLRLYFGIKNFFNYCDVHAMRLPINFNSFIGRVFYNIAKNKNKKIIVFKNDTLLKWESGYAQNYKKKYDLQFVNTKNDANWYSKIVSKHCDVIPVGNEYIFNNLKKKKNYNENSYLKTILYATGGVSIGIYSKEELVRDTLFLYNFASNNNYNIIIKPHPLENKKFLKNLTDYLSHQKKIKNFIIKEPTSNLDYLFKSTDLLITKKSTVILKAASYRIPVISLVSTYDRKKTNDFIGLAENINNLTNLKKKLNSFKNKSSWKKWKIKNIKMQNNFFEKNYRFREHPYKKVADILSNKIKNLN
jgi:hypothetical protein